MAVRSLSFKGKIVAITGGRRGQGRGYALAFAEAGADVAICDNVIEDGQLEKVADEIRKLGRRSLFQQVEVRNKAQVDKFIDRVEKELGPIDIFVNNAGMKIRKSLMDTTEEEFDTAMDINLKGYFLCAQEVAKRMIARKRGNIIQIASRGGFTPSDNGGSYDMAKAGVIMMTRKLARELAPYKIRVNCMAPGGVRTEFGGKSLVATTRPAGAHAPNLIGRVAEVEDCVGPVLFLASDELSGFINGYTILVDGGAEAGRGT